MDRLKWTVWGGATAIVGGLVMIHGALTGNANDAMGVVTLIVGAIVGTVNALVPDSTQRGAAPLLGDGSAGP